MMKNLKEKKGMTLIELIVGMMMFAILTAAVSAVLVPMLRVYARANEFAECNTLLDNVANQIIKDLSNATKELDLSADETILITIELDEIIYTVDNSNGVLLKNGIPVLSKSYYKNKSVNFSCVSISSSAGTAYMLTVIISSDENGEMIRRDYAVKPLALNQY